MKQQTENMESAETELHTESDAEQHERMRVLIGELVKTNQELRFKLATLEDEAERLKHGLEFAAPPVGMLF
jgi:hypothetical protein